MAEIRTFIAVEFSEELKDEIGQIQRRLKGELGSLKWVAQSNFHLTLKFLGDVDVRKIQIMKEGLTKAVQAMESFALGFAEVGGFPKIDSPRVVWLGVKQGREGLLRLQKVVDQELITQGFPPEKHSFSPHLTLARSKPDSDLSLIGQRLRQISIKGTRTDLIRSIRIMKSDLRPAGPVYTCLEEIFF